MSAETQTQATADSAPEPPPGGAFARARRGLGGSRFNLLEAYALLILLLLIGLFFSVLASGLFLAQPVDAHRLRPAIVTVTFSNDGGYTAALQLNLEALLAGIGPEHEDTSQAPQAGVYNALRELPAFAAAAPPPEKN